MRHRKATLKLNRTSSHRNAMFRNMVTSLFKYERIQTTDPKAKELRKWADNLITLAKRGDLHARRQALSIIREKDVVHELFKNAAERFGSKNGGYTRIIKVGRRPGDAALMSMVELVTTGGEPRKRTSRKKAKVATEKDTPDVKAVEVPEEEIEERAAADTVPADADIDAPVDTAETEAETESVEETDIEEEKQADSTASEDEIDKEKTD